MRLTLTRSAVVVTIVVGACVPWRRAPDGAGIALDKKSIVWVGITKDLPAPMVIVYRTTHRSGDSVAFRVETRQRLSAKYELRRTPRESAPDAGWLFIIPCYRDDRPECEGAATLDRSSGLMFAPRGAPIIPPPA